MKTQINKMEPYHILIWYIVYYNMYCLIKENKTVLIYFRFVTSMCIIRTHATQKRKYNMYTISTFYLKSIHCYMVHKK